MYVCICMPYIERERERELKHREKSFLWKVILLLLYAFVNKRVNFFLFSIFLFLPYEQLFMLCMCRYANNQKVYSIYTYKHSSFLVSIYICMGIVAKNVLLCLRLEAMNMKLNVTVHTHTHVYIYPVILIEPEEISRLEMNFFVLLFDMEKGNFWRHIN